MNMTGKLFLRSNAGLMLVVVLVGCSSEIPTQPGVVRAPSTVARNASGGHALHPNSEKYSDKGAKPATGRAGSALLSGRALIGKDGATTLELSTGQLDVSPPRGEIAKAQVKLFNGSALRGTLNYNHLAGGYVSLMLGGLARGTPLQVQANVRGVDGNRTDVVTLMTAAWLRPDLSVDMNVPDRASVKANTTIMATVTERNGDVGARANCDLFVDGARVDRAPAIWVEAGGHVACAFSQQFANPGTHVLRVVAADVSPADFDDSNNATERTIEIVNPSKPISFLLSANNRDDQYTTISADDWTYPDGSTQSSITTETRHVNSSTMLMGVNIPYSLPFPLTHLTFTLTSEGTVWGEFDASNVMATSTSPDGSQSCMEGFISGRFVQVCSYDQDGFHWTFADINAFSSDVVYFGSVVGTWFDPNYNGGTSGGWSYTYDGTYHDGLGSGPLGPSLGFAFRLESDGQVFQFSKELRLDAPFVPIPVEYGACYDYDFWFGQDHFCSNTVGVVNLSQTYFYGSTTSE
jgi:hypothetical protein